jgi:hypothetical protein
MKKNDISTFFVLITYNKSTSQTCIGVATIEAVWKVVLVYIMNVHHFVMTRICLGWRTLLQEYPKMYVKLGGILEQDSGAKFF